MKKRYGNCLKGKESSFHYYHVILFTPIILSDTYRFCADKQVC
jgi:hypothetical protein